MTDPIGARLRSLLRRGQSTSREVSLNPATPFEALLEQRLADLTADVSELRARLDGILLLVVGGVIADIVSRFLR